MDDKFKYCCKCDFDSNENCERQYNSSSTASSTEKKICLPFLPPKNAFVQEEEDERRRQCDEFCKYQAEL